MKWKLSRTEEILDGNLVCFVRLEGRISVARLRSALARVQRKHPLLGALIRKEAHGLYFEADSAPDIPLKVIQAAREDSYRAECQAQLKTEFNYGQPHLRVVWLQRGMENDLVFTTTHRTCDGMSLLIIVRETIAGLCSDEPLVPYQPLRPQDFIADCTLPGGWRERLVICAINGLLRLVPGSQPRKADKDHHLEWSAGADLSEYLGMRCKEESVSIHAALIVALDRALQAVYGEKCPKWIDSQIDPRRGRVPALKDDMLFLGGGGFKLGTAQFVGQEFWKQARAVQAEMPDRIAREIAKIPVRFAFIEKLRPIRNAQLQTIMRIHDAWKAKGANSFALSNWGKINVLPKDSPLRVKDLRVYVHSFKTKVLGIIPYTVNGDMRFYCVSHDDYMTRAQMQDLKRELMTALQDATMPRQGVAGSFKAQECAAGNA